MLKENFLVRIRGKDYVFSSVAKIREMVESGFCLPGSFVFSKQNSTWMKVCELDGVSDLFSSPKKTTEEENLYYIAQDYGKEQFKEGPFPFSKIKSMLKSELLCGSSWLLGPEEEWKQVNNFKEFSKFIAPLPEEKPSLTNFELLHSGLNTGSVSVKPPRVNKNTFTPKEPKGETLLDVKTEEDICELQDTKGSSKINSLPKEGEGNGDGIASRERTFVLSETMADRLELPSEPIWYIKRTEDALGNSAGPYRFAKLISMLESGEVTRGDKISLNAEKGFIKIRDQFEFNINHKIEGGKVFIARKHFRVNYITEVAVELLDKSSFMCDTLDISEGGAQLEAKNKVQLSVGDTLILSVLPGLIKKRIKIVAKVVRINSSNEAKFSVGFLHIDEKEKVLIQDFIRGALERKYA